jgi:hypothetical protein
VRNRFNFGIPNNAVVTIIRVQERSGIYTMPEYAVRRRAGQLQEWPCLIQIEDECAAMYFNIIYGARMRRRFTTAETGKPCEDFSLVARDCMVSGAAEEREIALFELT